MEDPLVKRLRSVQNERRDFPPETEAEAEIYHCREMICHLKIEAERRRQHLRIDYAFAQKRTITKVDGNLEVEETRTRFGWEKLDETSRQLIDEREAKGIEFFTRIIEDLRNGKQPARKAAHEPAKV